MQLLRGVLITGLLLIATNAFAANERTTLVHPTTKEKVVLFCPRGKFGYATFYDETGKYLRKKVHEPPSHDALVKTYKRLGYRYSM